MMLLIDSSLIVTSLPSKLLENQSCLLEPEIWDHLMKVNLGTMKSPTVGFHVEWKYRDAPPKVNESIH